MNILSTQTITHIIHIADIHVRVGNSEVARVNEYKHVFDKFVDEISALESVINETALLVICGDIFHSKCRMESAGTQVFFDWINQLLELVPICIICGNHDYKQSEPTITDSVEMLCTPYKKRHSRNKFNIHYLSQTGHYIWGNIGFGIVSVKDTLRAFNTSGIIENLPEFPCPKLFNTSESIDFKVALFHGTISQSALPSGKRADSVSHGYPLMWFAGYDAVMLGDNHKQQLHTHETREMHETGESKANQIMKWGYPGSLIQQDFGETLLGHGYILWDVETKSGFTHHINNNYGALTVVDESIYIAPTIKYSFKDAIALPYFPNAPRVRIIGDRDDIEICEALFKRYNISPCEIILRSKLALINKTSYSVQNASNNATQDETYDLNITEDSLDDDISKLTNLNSPEYWETYIKSTYVDSTQHEISSSWLHDPKQMMIPFNYNIHESLLDSIKQRNNKLEKLYTIYDTHVNGIAHNHYNISFKYMQWDYLMCYGESNYFDFTLIENKIALINGANATGKSAFLDVLCIAIYGEPTSSRRDFSGAVMSCKIINDHKPRGAVSGVSLYIDINEHGMGSLCTYEIQRTFVNYSNDEQSDSVKPSVIAVYKINNETQTKTVVAEGASTVDVWIAKYFGTIDEMLMSTILSQNDNINFFTHKPADQKLIIEKALHMDTISSFVSYLEETVKGHKYVLEKIQSYREGLMHSNGINTKKNPSNTCDITLDTLNALEVNLQDTKKSYAELLLVNNNLLITIGNLIVATEYNTDCNESNNEIKINISKLELLLEEYKNTGFNINDYELNKEKIIRLQIQRESLIEKHALLKKENNMGALENIESIESIESIETINNTLDTHNNTLARLEKELLNHISGYTCVFSDSVIEEKEKAYYDWLDINRVYIHEPNGINETKINTYVISNSELYKLLQLYKSYEDNLTVPVNDLEIEHEHKNNIESIIHNYKNADIHDINIEELYNTYISTIATLDALQQAKPVYNNTVDVSNIENIIAEYNTWISQIPVTWLTIQNSELIDLLHTMQSNYDVLMNDEYIRKPNVAYVEQVANKINNTKTYTKELLESLQQPIVYEKDVSKYNEWKIKWNVWCEFVKSVPDESLSELETYADKLDIWVNKINTACDTLTQLQKDVISINEEINIINKMEFNPECWACCKQPKMIRLQELKEQLITTNKRIAKYNSYMKKHTIDLTESQAKLESVREQIMIKNRYNDQIDYYTSEHALWESSLHTHKQEEKRKNKLAKVWWFMWNKWNNEVCKLRESIRLLNLYLNEYAKKHELYTIAVANKNSAEAFINWTQKINIATIKKYDSQCILWHIVKDGVKRITEDISTNNLHILNYKSFIEENNKWNDILTNIKSDKLYYTKQNKLLSDIDHIKKLIIITMWKQSWFNINNEYDLYKNYIHIKSHIDTINNSIEVYKRILSLRQYNVNIQLMETLNTSIDELNNTLIKNRDIYTRHNSHELNIQNINIVYNDIKERCERLTEFHTRFVGTKTIDGFKNWVYKNMVIPMIEREMNAFIINIDTFSVKIRMKYGKLIFMLHDRGSTPTLDHASGYQKYIAGLAMRIALMRIGAVGKNIKHLILDEGFVACDSSNILKTKEIMELLMKIGNYNSIMMISHLETIRDIADIRIDVHRCAKNITSYIRLGSVRKQLRKNTDETNSEVPKKKMGRPRKVKAAA